MTAFDFITDHLLNIDCLFDAHNKDDEQKPHQPYPLHQQTFQKDKKSKEALIFNNLY